MKETITLRLTLLGSNSVGKTSLCGQFISHSFNAIYTPTQELSTYRTVTSIENTMVLIQIDDLFPINHPSLLDPQEEHSENRQVFEYIVENKRRNELIKQRNPIFLEKAVDGIIFVFDISNKQSFELIEKMMKYIYNKEKERGREKHPRLTQKILVGNKNDLSKISVIKNHEIERVKKVFGVEYFKTSALYNKGVDNVFKGICKEILMQKHGMQLSRHSTIDSQFGIEEQPQTSIFTWCDCSRRTKNQQLCVVQ